MIHVVRIQGHLLIPMMLLLQPRLAILMRLIQQLVARDPRDDATAHPDTLQCLLFDTVSISLFSLALDLDQSLLHVNWLLLRRLFMFWSGDGGSFEAFLLDSAVDFELWEVPLLNTRIANTLA